MFKIRDIRRFLALTLALSGIAVGVAGAAQPRHDTAPFCSMSHFAG